MQHFTRNLLTEWRKLGLPFSDKTVLVAVSGGADSTALAFALYQLSQIGKIQNNFIIAHFNHNLRGTESAKDARFVKAFAKKLNFGFQTETARTGEINRSSDVEQSARNARYEFLLKTAQKTNSDAILTAHTINDQAETFLINMIRGSGIEGLSAMKAFRQLIENKKILLVRPFLNWAKREDVVKFAKSNKIEFRQDSMNNDIKFKRVRIRKELIPMLENFNPKIIETLANTAKTIDQENNLISCLLLQNEVFQDIVNSKRLSINQLKSLSEPMLYKVLRSWLLKKRGDLRGLERKHITAIKRLIKSCKSGRTVELPYFQKVIKEGGKLIFQA